MFTRSNKALLTAMLVSAMVFFAATDVVYARSGNNTSGPGKVNTQVGGTCKGPACNVKATTGPNKLPCSRPKRGAGGGCQ